MATKNRTADNVIHRCESCGERICVVPGCLASERALAVLLARLAETKR